MRDHIEYLMTHTIHNLLIYNNLTLVYGLLLV